MAGPSPSRRPLYALYAANTVSMTGNVMALVAIPWFVLVTTASPARTGLVAVFTVLPSVLAGFLGGTLVDRLGFRTMSIASDVASGLTMAAIPLLHATTGIELWQLLVLVFLGALLDGPGTTARSAILPDLAKPAAMPLERATAINQGISRGATMAGAPLAGLLIALFSATTVLWINAATFAFSAVAVAVAVPRPPAPEREEAGYFTELADGLRYLARDRLVRLVVGVVMITNFLDGPLFAVYFPVYAREELDSSVALGLMIGTFGAFALAGTLLYGAVGERLPRRPTFVVPFIVVGLAFLIIATLPPLWLALIVLAVAGLAAGPINPLITTVAYERIPADKRGRVLGTTTAGAYVAIPAGMLLAGYLVEWLGLGTTLALAAVAYLALSLSLIANPGLEAFDERVEPHTP